MSEEKNQKNVLRLKPETIIATSAVLISLCALVISVIEIRLMREQHKVAVYPHLDIDIDYNYNSEGFTISISNKGQGMAFVNNVQVWYEDRYFKAWRDIADYFMPEGHQISYATYRSFTIL